MSLKPYFILFCLMSPQLMIAQELKTFKVNPGEKVYEVITPNDRYAYPEFISGLVQFKNNRIGGSRMNYNALLPGMEFIDQQGDTLTLDKLETIRYLVMASDTFFVEKTALKQIETDGKIRLAMSRVIMISNHQRIGAMGLATDASVDAFTTLSSSGNPLKSMVAKEILTFKEHVTYYFGNKFGQFKQASKKNLVSQFGNHKKEITAYLEENNMNFFSEEDMRKLFGFLSKL
jgi:hypothetical protein